MGDLSKFLRDMFDMWFSEDGLPFTFYIIVMMVISYWSMPSG